MGRTRASKGQAANPAEKTKARGKDSNNAKKGSDSSAASSATASSFSTAPVVFAIWLAVTVFLFIHLRTQKNAAYTHAEEWGPSGTVNVIDGFYNPDDLGVLQIDNKSSIVFTASMKPVFASVEDDGKNGIYAMRVNGSENREEFKKPMAVWRPKKADEEENTHEPTFGSRECREPHGITGTSISGLKVKQLKDGSTRLGIILSSDSRQSIEFFDVTAGTYDDPVPATLKWVGCIFTPPHMNNLDFDLEEGRYVFASEAYGDTPGTSKMDRARQMLSPTPGRVYMFDTKEEKPIPKVVDSTSHAKVANGLVLVQRPTEWIIVYSETEGKELVFIKVTPPDRTLINPELDVVPSHEKTLVKLNFHPDNISYDPVERVLHVAGIAREMNMYECLFFGFMRWQPYCHASWMRAEVGLETQKVTHQTEWDDAARIGAVSGVVRDPNSKCFYYSVAVGDRIGHHCV